MSKHVKEIKAFYCKSFCEGANGGNLAGIVLDADDLTKQEMQKIATLLGFSETAFILKSHHKDYDFKTLFFTPNQQIDICGHAIIAAYTLMRNFDMVEKRTYSHLTEAGRFELEINEMVFAEVQLPEFYSVIEDIKEITESLGIKEDDLMEGLPVQIVSTGLKDLFIPVKNMEKLFSIKADDEKIKEISEKYDVVGYHVFTLDTKQKESTAHCRNFAPLYGINEESATGTSNSALACYLHHYDALEKTSDRTLSFEQGYVMNEPSKIYVKLDIKNHEIKKVKVGGCVGDVKEKIIKI